mgnify:CR=1 FL=1
MTKLDAVKTKISNIVSALDKKLSNGEELTFKHIGTLKRSENGNYVFKQDRTFNMLADAYGLTELDFVSAQEVKEELFEEESILVSDNDQVDSVSEWKCKFTLNYSKKLVRSGDIICGQAIVSAADTAMIVAVIGAIGKYQEITTVDIACKYLRPIMKKGGSLETEILKLGQRLVVGRITIKDNQSDKLAAEISCTYARL